MVYYLFYSMSIDQHVEYNGFLSFICVFGFFPVEPLVQSMIILITIVFFSSSINMFNKFSLYDSKRPNNNISKVYRD